MRTFALLCLVVGLTTFLLVSCGREAPFVEPATLNVDSTPQGAAISINNADTGKVTPYSFGNLEPTLYVVKVSMADHISTPDSMVVQLAPAGVENATFSLAENIGTLSVTSTPMGAAIYINDADSGETTDYDFQLVPGDYSVRVELAGHAVNPAFHDVTVSLGDTAYADFSLSQDTGSMTVTSTPAGAAIILDDNDTGEVTPHTFDSLVPDDYQVTVQLAGYSTPPAQTVTVVADQTATADFTLEVQNTSLTVTANIEGLTILLNGPDGLDDTQVTPHTFSDITAGTYTVAVETFGVTVSPASEQIELDQGDDETAQFTVAPSKVVMMEGFSNVNCVGCPFLSAMIENLMHTPGYGVDRLLYTKFSLGWPLATDPHYLTNTTENLARESYYKNGGFFFGLPTLYVEGGLEGSEGTPPDPADLQTVVDVRLAQPVSFGIGIDADLSQNPVPVAINLIPTQSADLSAYSLIALLVEESIEYEEPPGNQGETEFHWVMLDFATVNSGIGQLSAGTMQTFNTSLTKFSSPAFDVDNPCVIVFVQDNATKEIIQAGSTLVVTE